MKTEEIPPLSLFVLIFLSTSSGNSTVQSPATSILPTSSSGNPKVQKPATISLPNNTTTLNKSPGTAFTVMPTKERHSPVKEATSASSSSVTSPSATVTSHLPQTITFTTEIKATIKNTTSASSTHSKIWLCTILFLIVVLGLLVICIHLTWVRLPDEDRSVTGLLRYLRERLRTMTSNLWHMVVVQFCPAKKAGGEDEEAKVEEVEIGGRQKGDRRIGSNDAEHGKEKEEESDTSEDDYSSMEGDDLKVMALDRQTREGTNQTENKNKDHVRQGLVGPPSAPQVEGGDTKTASDEIDLALPSQGDKKTEFFEVTPL